MPWIVPIPSAIKLRHVQSNVGAVYVRFSDEELLGLNAAIASIKIDGDRLSQRSLEMTRVEAPPRRSEHR